MSAILVEPKILNHPWYRKWECGELPVTALQTYAKDYYWQVANFPRYLSGLHTQLETLEDRQVVLENLNEEENQAMPHPELWLDFAESLGLNRNEVKTSTPSAAAKNLVDTFRTLVASGKEEALGALLAYESQVPEVAHFKSKALKQHYLSETTADAGVKFFVVHEKADVWHTESLEKILNKFSGPGKERAQQAATKACSALWSFLDAMPN